MLKEEFTVKDVHQYRHDSPLRWILSHCGRYVYLPILIVSASILNNTAFSNIQLYVGKGFDKLLSPNWETGDLFILVLIIVGSALTQLLTGLGRNFGVEVLAQRIERNTREELYRNLLGKSQTFHGKQKIGDIMARTTNDVRLLNQMFSPGLMLIVDSGLSLLVPVVMIAFIHHQLLIVPILFTVVLSFTVWDYNRRLKPVSILQRDQFGIMNAGLTEAINGIEVVKSNVQENYEWRKFRHDASLFRDYFVQQGIIQAKYWPFLVFALAWGGALFHSLVLWKGGIISLGQVVSFMGLVSIFRFATFISLFSFNLVQMGLASAARILKMIVTETELDQNEHGYQKTIAGEVEFRNVSFNFNGKAVLRNINFLIKPGETVALVGQTGAGKTTLTRLINRIFDVNQGQVLVDKVDVRDWSIQSLRSQISTIEQDVFLFSQTISENIAFGQGNASLPDIQQAAAEAQAHGFIENFKQGYDTAVGERGVTLSGGQRQRIAIARAFLTNPRILVLDDSTSAVDSQTEDEIQQAMKKISRERTTFIITHRLSQIRWADRILVLRGGELVDQGNHHQLLERCPDYRRIFAFL
ncbi:ABC transporter ATP-binding protein [candidate division CSSED10-310 bacterium]|uniref:ABC transporter ATP-binding protein n=1 Tax=candidate division CSSED10-310 bacterium TaxID=2855610 RepID=A0ABV6Z1T6_UNCC1